MAITRYTLRNPARSSWRDLEEVTNRLAQLFDGLSGRLTAYVQPGDAQSKQHANNHSHSQQDPARHIGFRHFAPLNNPLHRRAL